MLLSHRVRFVPSTNSSSTESVSPQQDDDTAGLPVLVVGSPNDHNSVIHRPDINIDGVINTVQKVLTTEKYYIQSLFREWVEILNNLEENFKF